MPKNKPQENFDKQRLQFEKEIELMATMFKEPETILTISSKVSAEMVTEANRQIFSDIAGSENLDGTAILHLMTKHNYPFTKNVLDLSGKVDPAFVKHRIKEYYDIYYAIRTDKLLAAALEKSRKTLNGFDLLSDLEKSFSEELNKTSRFEKPKTLTEIYQEVINQIERKLQGQETSFNTKNFPSFNTATGGVEKGNLVGIAGAYKNGKTFFGLNLMKDYASQKNEVGFFTLEMSRVELGHRLIASECSINSSKLRNPRLLSDEDMRTLLRNFSANKTENDHILVFDKIFDVNGISAMIKKLKRGRGTSIFFVDYLGLIGGSKNFERRERELAFISNKLKLVASEESVAIFLIAQLNRTGIDEANSKNLAESIALARDCDFLFMIQKPNEVKENKVNIQDGSYFTVTLDLSRHTPNSGKSFLLRLDESGKMKEIMTRFDNSEIQKKSKGPVSLKRTYELAEAEGRTYLR